ncbi:MAG TPA: GntR family transcriptional regulator [Rhabdaerophilum sp.]|nr:GntR family transcriptional regulator [Rhabdaerophilum sp.]
MIEPLHSVGIKRRYLHDEVAERLRELIMSGELEPRERINENELCERFGISRTPLREALKILATEGLLELLPNRGARVGSVSEVEIHEIVEVVAGLEALAAELACSAATEADIDTVETKTLMMQRAYQRGDDAAYFMLNREIHEAIMQASRNATLAGLYTNLSSRIQRMRYRAHKTPEQWRSAMEDHLEIARLLRARDVEALPRVMRQHIRGVKEVIVAAYGV